MCILVIKKAGAVLPTKSTLETCFDNNPDGAGFMFLRKDGKMEGKKGFFTFKAFWKELKTHKFGKADTVFMHFRIATHGGITQGNCHPFPISGDEKDLKSTHFVAENAMAHNGVIRGLPEVKHMSDTQMFTKLILNDPIVLDNIDNASMRYLIESYTEGSRVAVMRRGELHLFGKFEDVEGVLYSNTSYQARKTYSTGYLNKDGKWVSFKGLYSDGYSSYYNSESWDEYDNFIGYDRKGAGSGKGTTGTKGAGEKGYADYIWPEDAEDGEVEQKFMPLDCLKDDIFECFLSNIDLREMGLSPEDLELAERMEEEFLNEVQGCEGKAWWTTYNRIWRDYVGY